MSYCMYLRKSRKDEELEQLGQGETLSRHYATLTELAQKMNIVVSEENIFKEIVSGDSIATRPVMQQLLSDVEQSLYEGVLVVDIERLARGNTIDQGIVAQTFQISNTKIITPSKTYDPSNEYDQEYFEFGLFMARKEYQTINRRLQQGRIRSVKEGKYLGNIAPYGYDKVKILNGKGYTLEANEETEIVQLIFNMYVNGDLSQYEIARRLNKLGIKPRKANEWSAPSIKDILSNSTYIGLIRWNRRKCVKSVENGIVKKNRPRQETYIETKGIHKPIIDMEIWNRAQKKKEKNLATLNHNKEIQNTLQGIIFCAKCGTHMQRRPYLKYGFDATLMCPNKCGNVSSKLYLVEEKVIETLKEYTKNFELDTNKNTDIIPNKISKSRLNKLEKELVTISSQIDKTHDLLEQGVYDTNTFIERKNNLVKKLENKKVEINEEKERIEEYNNYVTAKKDFIPNMKKIIDVYNKLKTPKQKNELLKTIIKKIEYYKKNKILTKNANVYDFELKIYFNIDM